MKNKVSYIALLGITIFSMLWGAFHTKTLLDKKESIINWDGYGYYMHLPSLFIYGDHLNYKKVNKIANSYNINTSYQSRALNDSIHYPVYPIGQSVTWLPFFTVAHWITYFTNDPSDGFSAPYQWAVFISSILFVFIGFYFNRKLLLFFFKDKMTALAMLLIFLASNYLYYSHYEISLTQVYLYGYLSVFLYCTNQYNTTRQSKYLLLASLALGIGVLTRNSEIFWILIPLIIGVNIKTIFSKQTIFSIVRKGILFSAIAGAFYILFQVTYYKISTYQWFINGYSDHSFNFLQPNFTDCLFGFYKGWFIYTPLAFLFVAGFILMYKKNKDWFYPSLIFTLLYIYLLISWDDWTYGSTFSFRPIVPCYSLFILPLAYCLEFILIKARWLSIVLILGIVSLQTIQMWQYSTGILLREKYSFSYYKKVFLKLTLNKKDRIIIDIPTHKYKHDYKVLQTLHSKSKLHIGAADKQLFYPIYTLQNKTIRLQTKIDYSYIGDSYGSWDQPRLITQSKPANTHTYWSGLRLPEIMNDKRRDTIIFNQFINTIGDSLQMYIASEVPDSIVIHNITIKELEK